MSISTAPASRMTAAAFGKVPTTRQRRLNYLLTRARGLVDEILRQCAFGNAAERGPRPGPRPSADRLLVAGSYLFSFQSTSLLLEWLGHTSRSAFGPFPEGFPARSSVAEVFGYGGVNAMISFVGIGLVLLGARIRSRREARRDVVTVG